MHLLGCTTSTTRASPPLPLLALSPPVGVAGAYPRQYYYDRLARTTFWASLLALLVMVCHLAALGALMWRQARVPNVMWFPRVEAAICLAILPALAYGAAGECVSVCRWVWNGRGRGGLPWAVSWREPTQRSAALYSAALAGPLAAPPAWCAVGPAA